MPTLNKGRFIINIKMLVFDLDGTLLRSDKTISAFTLEVLAKCRENGLKIVIATARSRLGAMVAQAVPADALIYDGGAAAVAGGQRLYNKVISAAAVDEIFKQMLQKIPNNFITAESEYEYFTNRPPDEDAYGQFLASHGQNLVFTKFKESLRCELNKITVQMDVGLAKEIAEGIPEVDVLAYTGEPWVRIAHRDATKFKGIEAVAAHFGINVDEVAAFGDDYNDVEMLEKCGIGVAMANAIGEAKAAANFVCGGNDEDGVANWLASRL